MKKQEEEAKVIVNQRVIDVYNYLKKIGKIDFDYDFYEPIGLDRTRFSQMKSGTKYSSLGNELIISTAQHVSRLTGREFNTDFLFGLTENMFNDDAGLLQSHLNRVEKVLKELGEPNLNELRLIHKLKTSEDILDHLFLVHNVSTYWIITGKGEKYVVGKSHYDEVQKTVRYLEDLVRLYQKHQDKDDQ